jgi:hypothetical protein
MMMAYFRIASVAAICALAAVAWAQSERASRLQGRALAAEAQSEAMKDGLERAARQAAAAEVSRVRAREEYESVMSKIGAASDACLDQQLPIELLD